MTRQTLLLPLLAAVLATAAAAQEPETKDERRRALFDGTHVLRRILHDHGFTSLDGLDERDLDPGRTLLVALGDLSVLDGVPGGLESFVRRGGALLAASDRAVKGTARGRLLAVSGVTIGQETLVSYATEDCYKGKIFCPRVQPLENVEPSLFHEPRSGELSVYTNIPSYLVYRGQVGSVRPLAIIPPHFQKLRRETGSGPPIPMDEPALFAVGGEVGRGRVLALADHSVFINQMMLPQDTNNVEFSYNTVRWLQGEGRRKRDRVYFVEDGAVQTKLDIPLKSVNLPPEELAKILFAKRNELLVGAEETLTRLEDENAFNRKLLESLAAAGFPPERLIRLAVLLGSLVGLALLAYRLGVRGRFRHDTTVPVLTGAVGRGLPEEPLAEQRQKELLKRKDLREPAAVLVRRWFGRLGLEAGEKTPAFAVRGGWWLRWRLTRKLRRLWRLARGTEPARVTPAELWRLQRELEQLHAGWQRGAWRIAG